MDEGYQLATKLLNDNIDELHIISNGLLEYETLSGDEIKALLKGQQPVRDTGDDTPPEAGSAVPSTGGAKSGDDTEDTGGMEPQPQA